MIHRISATELARSLGDVLARVRYRNDEFVVERNGEPVARLVPEAGAVCDVDAILPEIGDEPAALPAIVLAELLVGVRLAPSPSLEALRQARVDALRARVPVVDFGADAASWWASLFVELRRSGSSIPANDLGVASMAMALGWAGRPGRDAGRGAFPPCAWAASPDARRVGTPVDTNAVRRAMNDM